LRGIPFRLEEDLRIVYTGSASDLINPFALLCGLIGIVMISMHGAVYLQMRTSGVVNLRAMRAGRIAALLLVALFALAGSSADLAAQSWGLGAATLVVAGALGAVVACRGGRAGTAFLWSSLSLAGVVLTAAGALFPLLVRSSTDPGSSLSVWNATSSHRTLQLMLWAALLFVPLIVVYTGWVYRVLRGRISAQTIYRNGSSA